MRFATLAACCLLLLSGCTSSSGSSEPVTCGNDIVHPYENRCVENDGGEGCHIWVGEGIQRDDYIYCNATTDGRATVQVEFEGSGSLDVNVFRQVGGDYEPIWNKQVGVGSHDIPAFGQAGTFRVSVGFADATGPVDVWLWG